MRGGGIDHDPTEGLPVQQYTLDAVTIKQDTTSANADESNQTEHNDAGFPWPEPPLPSYINQLPAHSQVSPLDFRYVPLPPPEIQRSTHVTLRELEELANP